MKICAISPFESASKKYILDFISTKKHNLIALPGSGPNHPSVKQVKKVLGFRTKLFLEDGNGKLASTPYLVSRSNTVKMPSQIFSQNPTTSDIDRLCSNWSKRTHRICNYNVSFAICGEIDAFHVNGYAKFNRHLPFDILINPTHTIRGRWNHLGRKLINLSEGRAVIHTANNSKNHHKLTSNLRIYVDGVMYQQNYTNNLSWSECEI